MHDHQIRRMSQDELEASLSKLEAQRTVKAIRQMAGKRLRYQGATGQIAES